jgi:hypothetical protein
MNEDREYRKMIRVQQLSDELLTIIFQEANRLEYKNLV